ncbi:MAG: ABC transporter substrate-binding protein [Deltaproteobacteria bacterium]|jgi:ABC-type branched-subunit amino acid transport system substrate-binding protein|nr:ABC transporter substrate-binding protein [Deltaproteobacteria bacterium]
MKKFGPLALVVIAGIFLAFSPLESLRAQNGAPADLTGENLAPDIYPENSLSPEAGVPDGAGLAPETDTLTAEDLKPAIVFVAPKEGPLAPLAQGAFLGADLAHKKYGGELALLSVSESPNAPYFTKVVNPGRVKVVIGHLSESALTANAPYYRQRNLPVLLPFLDNWETEELGAQYFRLVPDVPEQGRLLARFVLGAKKKPKNVLIIESPEAPFALLSNVFQETLRDPYPPGPDGAPKKGPLRPLAKTAKVEIIPWEKAEDLPAVIASLKGTNADFILLALSTQQALQVAPLFCETSFGKANFLGGTALANRDMGSAFAAMKLALFALVPTDPGNYAKKPELRDFTVTYQLINKRTPTWTSVMAYDAVHLAIKAYSTRDDLFSFLRNTEKHVGLAGEYAFGEEKIPSVVLQVDQSKAANHSYLP